MRPYCLHFLSALLFHALCSAYDTMLRTVSLLRLLVAISYVVTGSNSKTPTNELNNDAVYDLATELTRGKCNSCCFYHISAAILLV